MRILAALLLLLPLPVLAGPPALTCRADVVCLAGGDCVPSGGEVELDPEGNGYTVFLDAGAETRLAPLGTVAGGIVHYNAVSAEGVAVLVSIYQDGRLAMTVQQDVDGPHVETTFGFCKPRT